MILKKLSRIKRRLKRKLFMKKTGEHWCKRPKVKPWIFCSFCNKHFDWWERIQIIDVAEYYWDLNIESRVLKSTPVSLKICCECAKHSNFSLDKIRDFIKKEIPQKEAC